MKMLLSLKLLTVGALLTVATTVKADTIYDFTYTQVAETYTYGSPNPGTVTDATGTLVLSGNTVVSGTLTVTGTGPDNGNYILLPLTGSDSLIQYDNVWPIDSALGLAWSSSGAPGNSTEMNMWYTGAGEYGQPGGYYTLWGGTNPNSSTFNVETYGTFSQSVVANDLSVPDGGATVALLGGALIGLQALKRKLVS